MSKRGRVKEKCCIYCQKPIFYRSDAHDWVHEEDLPEGDPWLVDPHCRKSADHRRKRAETKAEPYRWPTQEWLDA